ncbi:MAG: hypothetical protein RL318_332 [Fibrobacterota bacterium]
MKRLALSLSKASSICALALATAALAIEAPQHGTFSGTSGFVVGQPFAVVPQAFANGTALRVGYWSGPDQTPPTTGIRTVSRPSLGTDGWVKLSRTRLDLEATTTASGQDFLSEIDAVRCSESPDCIGVSVKLEKPQRLDISIFDQLGVPVGTWSRHFDKSEIALRRGASEAAWLGLGWNGRSAQGRLVGSGVYLVRVNKTFDHGEKAEEILKVGIRTR